MWRFVEPLFLMIISYSITSTFEVCEDSKWKLLHEALLDADRNSETYGNHVSPHLLALTDQFSFEWYKTNYQDCVEGLVSLVLYFATVHDQPRRQALLDLADRAARELNPLALRSGQSKWPFFGQLGELHLIWQDGGRMQPLDAEPWHLPPCSENAPSIISPLLTVFDTKGDAQGRISSIHLAYGLQPGALLIDAGVFDGTDWTMAGVAAGAIVLGFEPLVKNRNLFQERFPVAVAERTHASAPRNDGSSCRFFTMLDVVPGQASPSQKWADVFPAHDACSSDLGNAGHLGHAFIFGAALGEAVRSLNMTTRYDYSSVADQGYLKGPKDLDVEQVAMTTLDHVFANYVRVGGHGFASHIDVLKVDVEGYELGVLRGAERLLSEGRVRYIMMEFHPGMLGTTGTDPHSLLAFVRHYCFLCYSLKIRQPLNFVDFIERYTKNVEMLPLQGLGALEDLICENIWWREPPPLAASQASGSDPRAQAWEAATGS